jgi:hypothetical protein
MIEVIKFKSHKNGCLLGFADIFVKKMGLEINGVTIAEKNGKKWVNMPSKEYTNEQGEKKYAPIIRFRDKDVQERFCKTVLEAIVEAMPQGGQEPFIADEQQDLPF